MNSLVGQRLWKWKLVAGLLTIVLGAIVLAWPGPSILVASTLFGVYLLFSGLAELFIAVTVRLSTATRVMLFISGALSVVDAQPGRLRIALSAENEHLERRLEPAMQHQVAAEVEQIFF